MDRSTDVAHTANIRDAYKRRDWNAVEDVDGELDHTAESLLADYVDFPASPGLQQLREGDLRLTPEDRVGVGVFIAAQMGRSPGWRDEVGKFQAEAMQQILSLAAQHYSDDRWEEITGTRPSKEVRDRIASGEAFELKVDKGDLFVSQQVAHDLGPYVAAMSWTLVEFEHPWLFSSGMPVVLLSQTPPHPMTGVGLGTADATYVPLSASRALWLRAVNEPDYVVAGTRAVARRLNYQMLTAAQSDHLLMSLDAEEHPLPATLDQAAFPEELMRSDRLSPGKE